jgi:hypothetical protein
MAKCRNENCKKEFKPVQPEPTKTYHAHRVGFCSDRCSKVAGALYDLNVRGR